MSATVEQVTGLIGTMETKEVEVVVEQAIAILKAKRNVDSTMKRTLFKAGDRVVYTGRRSMGAGTIERVNYTKALVKFDSDPRRWNVPLANLERES